MDALDIDESRLALLMVRAELKAMRIHYGALQAISSDSCELCPKLRSQLRESLSGVSRQIANLECDERWHQQVLLRYRELLLEEIG